MEIRRIVVIDDETLREGGRPVARVSRRAVACAVIANPFAGRPAQDDHTTLIDLSVEVGDILCKRALRALGDVRPTGYGKVAIVGLGGQREHGAAMIHVRLGLAMRASIGRGRALIPGVEKVGGPGARVDLVFGGIDDSWDYDQMDAMEISIPGAPAPEEIVLAVGFAGSGRANARTRGAPSAQVEELVRKLAGAAG